MWREIFHRATTLLRSKRLVFESWSNPGQHVQINQQANLDLTLQIGSVTETMEVTGQAPLLESESSSLGTVVNQKLVNELPLNGRNFIQLAPS